MSTLGIFKHIIERKKEALKESFSKTPERIDNCLPLNIRLNTMVEIDEVPFILNEGKWHIANPGKSHTVMGIGKFSLYEMDFYRFYLEGNVNREKSILQITKDEGKITDTILYRVFDEVYPCSNNEWDEWLNEGNGLIGYKDFQIQGQFVFQRTLGEGDYQPPVAFNETVILDPFGQAGFRTSNENRAWTFNDCGT